MTSGVERIDPVRAREDDWHLRDEQDLLRRSLDDARREHLAGDLSDEDYELLRARDERRLAQVEAALSVALGAPGTPEVDVAASDVPGSDAPGLGAAAPDATAPDATAPDAVAPGSTLHLHPGVPGARVRWRRRWHRRWWLAALGVASLLAATVLLVVDLTTPRLPGQYATGSITLNTAQRIARQLAQAKTLVAGGSETQAMQLYGEVLAEDPRQPVALAEWGWLDWRAASAAKDQTLAAEGASALEEAVKVDPKLFVAQYYLGAVLYDEGTAQKAVAHFARFLADKPTATWLSDAAPEIRAAYAAAHEPLPSGVPRA